MSLLSAPNASQKSVAEHVKRALLAEAMQIAAEAAGIKKVMIVTARNSDRIRRELLSEADNKEFKNRFPNII